MSNLKNMAIIIIFLNLGTYVLSVTVTVQPSQYYITKGQNATLLCTYELGQDESVDAIQWYRTRDNRKQKILKVEHSGNTQVTTWYQDFSVNDPISNQGRGSFLGNLGSNSASIQINNIVAADDAEYSCSVETITNPPGGPYSYDTEEKTLHLYLNILPTSPTISLSHFNSHEGIINLFTDDTVNMTCTGNVGRPSGRLRWEQSYGISDIWERTLLETSYQVTSNNSDGTAAVQIEYSKTFLVSDDSSKIRCSADRESYGLNDIIYSTVIQFLVKDANPVTKESIKVKATNTESIEGTNYRAGERVQLKCDATGYPIPAIKWFKDSKELGTNVTLDLGVVTEANAGTYVCGATNEIGGTLYEAQQNLRITIDPSVEDIKDGAITGLGVSLAILAFAFVIVITVNLFYLRKKGIGCFQKPPASNTDTSHAYINEHIDPKHQSNFNKKSIDYEKIRSDVQHAVYENSHIPHSNQSQMFTTLPGQQQPFNTTRTSDPLPTAVNSMSGNSGVSLEMHQAYASDGAKQHGIYEGLDPTHDSEHHLRRVYEPLSNAGRVRPKSDTDDYLEVDSNQ